jgi:hypothetical protein
LCCGGCITGERSFYVGDDPEPLPIAHGINSSATAKFRRHRHLVPFNALMPVNVWFCLYAIIFPQPSRAKWTFAILAHKPSYNSHKIVPFAAASARPALG